MNKQVLVACECSGTVRDALIRQGIDAISCDILPSATPGPHIQDDVLKHLNGWRAIIAFPPCTHLSNAQPKRLLAEKIADGRTGQALAFIRAIYNASDTVCIENPVSGYLNTHFRKYDQIVEPFYFGHDYRKRTCLWLKNLPPLLSTLYCTPTYLWVDSGSWKTEKLIGRHRSSKHRSQFHVNIADAMAAQWKHILNP